MSFRIVAKPPRLTGETGADADELSGLLQDIFFWGPDDDFDSDVVMFFNEIPITLECEYDVAIIIEEIVDELLVPLTNRPEGHVRVGWPSNTFRTNWELDWRGGGLKLRTEWFCVGSERMPIEFRLNERSLVTMDLQAFLDEWRKLLWVMIPLVLQAAPDVTRFDMWSRLLSVAGPPSSLTVLRLRAEK